MDGFIGKGRFLVIFIVIIIVIAVGLGSVFLTGINPTVTGFVSATTYTQYVNAEIDQNSGYFFAASDKEAPQEIRSLSISAKILGSGVANVYLEDQDGNKYLVISNEKQKSFNRITGLAVSRGYSERQFDVKPISEADDLIDDNKISKDEPFSFIEVSGARDVSYVEYSAPEQEQEQYMEPESDGVTGFTGYEAERPTGMFESWFSSTPYEGSPFKDERADYMEFRNECIETCVLFGGKNQVYRFIFEIEPGTRLIIDSVTYSVNEETKPLM